MMASTVASELQEHYLTASVVNQGRQSKVSIDTSYITSVVVFVNLSLSFRFFTGNTHILLLKIFYTIVSLNVCIKRYDELLCMHPAHDSNRSRHNYIYRIRGNASDIKRKIQQI